MDELIGEYKSQFWLLGDELLLKRMKCHETRGDAKSRADAPEVKTKQLWSERNVEDCARIPHPLELDSLVSSVSATQDNIVEIESKMLDELRRSKQEFIRKKLPLISRLESSCHSNLCRDMDTKGAIAIIAGLEHTYYIRSNSVLLGREEASSTMQEKSRRVDIDLTEEIKGSKNAVSRAQARLFLDSSGSFRIQNIGKRKILVDDEAVLNGEVGRLSHLSLITIGTSSFIFMVNSRGVARINQM